jgi:hypothetical protein
MAQLAETKINVTTAASSFEERLKDISSHKGDGTLRLVPGLDQVSAAFLSADSAAHLLDPLAPSPPMSA